MGTTRERPVMRHDTVTVTPTTPPAAGGATSGSFTQLVQWLMGAVSRITGKSDWRTAPDHDMVKLFQYGMESRNIPLTGGGDISFGVTAASKLKWTHGLNLEPVPDEVSPDNYIELGSTPTSGVTDHASAERANASGITLNAWESLWLIHTRGSTAAVGNTWRVAGYATALEHNLFSDEDAFLIAFRYGGTGGMDTVTFRNGVSVANGTTAYKNGTSHSQVDGVQTVRAADAAPMRVVNTNNAGAGADIGADNMVSFRDAENDEQAYVGLNDLGDFELGSLISGRDLVWWEQAASALRKLYHEGNHGRLYSVKHARVATTTSIDLSGDETIDTIDLDQDDRVLVKDQPTSSQNGLYSVNTSGAWVRVADMNESAEVYNGLLVMVAQGAVNAGTLFRLTTLDPITLGTTGLSFGALSGGGAVTAHNFWSATHGDVDATDTPQNGEAPIWDSSTSRWKAALPGYQDPTFMTGMVPLYLSTTQIQIDTGAVWIPAEGKVFEQSSVATLTPTLAASTKYYIYAHVSGGSLAYEITTTGPSVYRGFAKQGGTNSNRRYVGYFLTNASSQIVRFGYDGNFYEYLVTGTDAAPYRILTTLNTATTATQLTGAASLMPTSSRKVRLWMTANNFERLTLGTAAATDVKAVYERPGANFSQALGIDVPTDASQHIWYRTENSGGDLTLDVVGFYERR